MSKPRLRMTGIHKRYGGTHALRGVDLELRPGEVHALVGENGAGKSTLMKVLSGAVAADEGVMQFDGQPYAPHDPHAARQRGVAMIYQELALCPHLSVAANVVLGVEPSRWGWLRPTAERQRVRAALTELGHADIDPDAAVADLSPAGRQLVEIARALVSDVRLLILDEPTSALTAHDARQLFALIGRLRDRGVTVVYISHYLEEVEAVADRLTVLRDGQAVWSGSVRDTARQTIIEAMVGRPLDEQYPRVSHTIGEVVLEVTSANHGRLVLRRGEILGIAGIIGAGRTEWLRQLFGLEASREWSVRWHGQETHASHPRTRIQQGFGLLSEDRKTEGLALDRSISDNLTLSRLQPYALLGWLREGQRQRAIADWLTRLGVRCRSADQAVGELSGGNQQKVALGRLLHQEADVLLLDEPTRGVDVASKAEIYRLIGQLASQGKAVLMVSSYLPELLGVCDTLAVMNAGRLSETRPVQEWTPEQVMAIAVTRNAAFRDDSMSDAPER